MYLELKAISGCIDRDSSLFQSLTVSLASLFLPIMYVHVHVRALLSQMSLPFSNSLFLPTVYIYAIPSLPFPSFPSPSVRLLPALKNQSLSSVDRSALLSDTYALAKVRTRCQNTNMI